ncbi:MAG: hypothetical protein L3J39_05125 [Verrucomicrobiales bacterium]|nr:hypothetical protein [Verrucomicrobiales bacterium]
MAEELYSTNGQSNRTFTVAMWVLGAIAGAQFLAVAWAIMRHQPADKVLTALEVKNKGAVASSQPESARQPYADANGGLPPMPEIFRRDAAGKGRAALLPTPPLAGLGGVGSTGVGGGLPSASRLHSSGKLNDPEVERLVNTAIELRARGDMNAALRTFQAAEAKLPDHPRILSEIAGTYSQLGLGDKALSYWEKVFSLGEQRAGAYFDMADMVLKGKQMEPVANQDSVLSIGKIAEIEDKSVTAGERITLRVEIKAKAGVHPAGGDMALLVYFYDLVDGKSFLPSTADTSESYISAPYDWVNGESEQIEVTYYQPVFTREQKRDLGERVYYGYIVELYYRDELQDVVAAPRKLMGLNPSAPPIEAGAMSGPDSSLFPK